MCPEFPLAQVLPQFCGHSGSPSILTIKPSILFPLMPQVVQHMKQVDLIQTFSCAGLVLESSMAILVTWGSVSVSAWPPTKGRAGKDYPHLTISFSWIPPEP